MKQWENWWYFWESSYYIIRKCACRWWFHRRVEQGRFQREDQLKSSDWTPKQIFFLLFQTLEHHLQAKRQFHPKVCCRKRQSHQFLSASLAFHGNSCNFPYQHPQMQSQCSLPFLSVIIRTHYYKHSMQLNYRKSTIFDTFLTSSNSLSRTGRAGDSMKLILCSTPAFFMIGKPDLQAKKKALFFFHCQKLKKNQFFLKTTIEIDIANSRNKLYIPQFHLWHDQAKAYSQS